MSVALPVTNLPNGKSIVDFPINMFIDDEYIFYKDQLLTEHNLPPSEGPINLGDFGVYKLVAGEFRDDKTSSTKDLSQILGPIDAILCEGDQMVDFTSDHEELIEVKISKINEYIQLFSSKYNDVFVEQKHLKFNINRTVLNGEFHFVDIPMKNNKKQLNRFLNYIKTRFPQFIGNIEKISDVLRRRLIAAAMLVHVIDTLATYKKLMEFLLKVSITTGKFHRTNLDLFYDPEERLIGTTDIIREESTHDGITYKIRLYDKSPYLTIGGRGKFRYAESIKIQHTNKNEWKMYPGDFDRDIDRPLDECDYKSVSRLLEVKKYVLENYNKK